MFDAIAHRYDLLNRMMSMGMDVSWRKAAVKALELAALAGRPERPHVLDVATGTGDVAMTILKRHRDSHVTGLDPSANMMTIAARKAVKAQATERLRLLVGDAQAMPFADNTFDGATIAFGIRNVPDRLQGLREMARVVRPGGRVVVLELTEPRKGLLQRAARVYIHKVVPRLGAWLSGKREYAYLQKSIAAFPPPGEFADMMRMAGMEQVKWDLLGFGSVGLHVGVVPAASSAD